MNLALTLEALRILIYFFLDYKRSCCAPYKSPKLTNLPNLANLSLKETINRLRNRNKYLNRTRTFVLGPAPELGTKELVHNTRYSWLLFVSYDHFVVRINM